MLGLLSACEDVRAVWIKNGSTADHLVFYFGRKEGRREAIEFGGFGVKRCSNDESGQIMWGMEGAGGTQSADSAVYGVSNEHFTTSSPKRNLAPGCYTASTSGTGRVTFDVRRDGSIAARAPDINQ